MSRRLVPLLLLVLFAPLVQGAPVYVDFRGPGGSLGHSATFFGDFGLEVYVSAFTADPTTADNIRQKSTGLGTEQGVNDVSNDVAAFGAQLLSFSTSIGQITAIEIESFGRAEEVAFYASLTDAPPALSDPTYELLFTSDGLMGNPDLFDIPVFSQPFLHVVSLTGAKPTELRVSGILVEVLISEPGILGLLAFGLTGMLAFRSRSGARTSSFTASRRRPLATPPGA